MRRISRILVAATISVLVTSLPASAAAPGTASCPGQELSVIAPVLRAELGAFLSFEAQNAQLEGWSNFGQEISTFSHADRATCPEDE